MANQGVNLKLPFSLSLLLIASCSAPIRNAIVEIRPRSEPSPDIVPVRMNEAGFCHEEALQLMSKEQLFQSLGDWRNPALDYSDKRAYVEPKNTVLANVVYPPAMLHAGKDGTVMVLLLIDAKGNVRSANAVCATSSEFISSALASAKKMKYQPATLHGIPVKDGALQPIRFVSP